MSLEVQGPPDGRPRRRRWLAPFVVGALVATLALISGYLVVSSHRQQQVEVVQVRGTVGGIFNEGTVFSLHPDPYGPATYMYTALPLHENLPGRQLIRPGERVVVTVVDYEGTPAYVGRVDPIPG